MAEKNGVTIIPASQRPDGTWRKEIRVKAGYVPPDEAERYQSRGKQWSSKASDLPPGMSSTTQGGQPEEAKKSKNQKKNERKKQKKLEESSLKSTKSSAGVNNLFSEVEKLQIDKSKTEKQPEPAAAPVSKDALEKKIKGLKKKLRQIEDLESKLSSGQIKELTKEQIDKVSRKKDLLDELEELELDLKLCD